MTNKEISDATLQKTNNIYEEEYSTYEYDKSYYRGLAEGIKQKVKLTTVYDDIERYQRVKYVKGWYAKCPFCRSKNFIIKFNQRMKCFNKNCKTFNNRIDPDVVEYLELKFDVSFSEAIDILEKGTWMEYLNSTATYTVESNDSEKRDYTQTEIYKEIHHLNKKNKVSEKSMELYQLMFDNLENVDEYLTVRGISKELIDKYHIKGILDVDKMDKLLRNNSSYKERVESGLYGDEKHYFIFHKPCIIFTMFKEGKPYYFACRFLNKTGASKYYKMIGRKQELFTGNIENEQTVYVFEGIFDALSYEMITGKDNFISPIGTGHKRIIEKYVGKKLIFAFDNDEVGKKRVDQILNEWTSLGIKKINYDDFFEEYNLVIEEFKDLNDVLLQNI